ncbi:LysM peptidoglycan-binding domain-containing protein [Priestia megaterium]|nr:LysM peptidoglycan-binding domain-containing protein [Priestia megaterium]
MKKKQLALSVGAIMGGTFLFQASADASTKVVEVQPGDTLWSLSRQHNTTVEALRSTNKLSSNDIRIGQKLTVPSNSTTEKTVSQKPASSTTSSTYKVQAGDTLWKIATRFNMNIEDLKRLNSLSTNTIYINQQLKVKGSTHSSVPDSSSVTPPPKKPVVGTNGTYKVQSGDTLFKIANRFNMSVNDLKAANNLTSSNIYVNQQLKVKTNGGNTNSSSKPGTTAPANGQLNVSKMIADAKKYMGVPYKWGGTTPSGFDCSGFIYYVMKQQISLPRYTTAGFWSTSQSVSSPQVGDLVFFSTYTSGPSHLGIYLGNRQFIHAGSSTGVTISSLDNSYWSKRYLGAKRFSK